jgi:lipopolysaccharide export system protein LptA
MLRRIRDYSLALVMILIAFALYAQTVVRWIEPVRAARPDDQHIHDPAPNLPNPYQHLFEPGDWELNSPKVLLTSQGTLLFLDYQPLDSGRLEIRPCTLILYSQDDEGAQSGRPVVMRAAEGAILHFDEDVDLTRGQFGRLIGGRILGEIRIFSPESAPGAADSLELITRNLQIERTKAWTPHDVKFRYGASRGSGQNLEMMLSPAEQTAGKGKMPVIGGVETVQLTQIDELILQSQKQSLIPSTAESDKPDQPQPPVRITCDGPLKFDVNRRVATFDDNVLVQRLMPDGLNDRLRCSQLAVYLGSEKNEKAAGKSADAAAVGSVERIVAIGKPVVLEAASQNAYTEAERLEYNLKTRQMQLKSLKSGAKVLLRRGSDEFRAPEVAYELVEGKRLGKLWAPGPGRLVTATGTEQNKRPFAAEWQQEIRIRPDGKNDLISLLGGAKLDAEGQGTFQAEELHLWVLEIPSSIGSQPVREQKQTAGQAGSLSYIVPDRLLATGRVHADSPQMAADADRLEAWFTQIPDSLPQVETKPSGELSLVPADGSASPELREPVLRIREPLPAKAVQHFHVVGEVIQMQVQQRGKSSSVDQITVEGKQVRITETNAAENEQPLWLAGTRIALDGGTGESCHITVTGHPQQPAILAARGLKLRSETLKLSRRDNRVTVDQAGDMTLPISRDAQGRLLAEPGELSIAWRGSMLFDGSAARFRQGVVVRGDTYGATADEMHAVLTSQIDFGRPKQSDQKPELKRLTMTGGAEFDSRTFNPDDGRLQTQEHMSAHSLDVDRISGAIQGAGPGWLSRVQVGQASLPAQSDPKTGKPPAGRTDELTYLRVEFRNELVGNLHRRQVEFSDQVQAVNGPVLNWDDTINPRSRDALGDRGLVLTADRLSVAEFLPPGAKKGSMEMTATGNTRVEGRDYTAFAHRLTYAAAKSQLILEGDGRNEAEVKHQYRDSVRAQKLLYWPDNGAVQIEGGKSFSIGPTSSRPMPPRSPRDRK